MIITLSVAYQKDFTHRLNFETITLDKDELKAISEQKFALMGIEYDNIVSAGITKIELDKEDAQ